MRLTVTGIGHLGLVHAACMAELGHEVLGLDIDPERVSAANSAEPWFSEPGLAAMLRTQTLTGKLWFTTSFEEIAQFADVHFLCLPSPVDGDGVHLDMLFAAVNGLSRHLEGPHLLAGKSTVPPGTAALLQRAARSAGSTEIEVCWNPEFLSEGTAIEDTLRPDRIVLGRTPGGMAEDRMSVVYERLIFADSVPLSVMSLESAELAKLASNAFLAAKISFFNGTAQLASHWGADARAVAAAAGMDSRIGDWGTRTGIGWGGGCLPKDLDMLKRSAENSGLSSFPYLLGAVREINRTQRNRAGRQAWHMLGELKDKTVAILGIAFKPGTSDTRDSPGLDVAAQLGRAGAVVICHDPEAVTQDVMQFEKAGDAIREADLVIVCTDWPEYRGINPGDFSPGRIIDARYFLDRKKWEDAGWEFRVLD